MFQKLYRHLEAISDATKRQEESAALSQEWGARISQQLDSINEGIAQGVQETRLQKPAASPWRAFAVIGAMLTVLLAGVLVVLLVSVKNIRDHTQVALDRSADNGQVSQVLFTQLKIAHEKTEGLETTVARLDSLVRLQSETIIALKKLNETTVRSFLHIRNELQDVKKQAGRGAE